MNAITLAPRQTDISTTIEPTIALDIPWIVPSADETDAQSIAWARAKSAWLDAKRRKSGSDHTVRSYERDWFDFFTYISKAPWMVSSIDADEWRRHLEEDRELKLTSINRKLAALSSFYTYVIDKFSFVGSDHVERSIYIDSHGNPRSNPFKRVDRYQVESYGNSRPLTPAVIQKALNLINQERATGARDYALIVTYIFTGRRANEIAQLRWGDIETDEQRGRTFYTWTGKGNKSRIDEMPPPAWHAIRAYLRTVGRLETIKPGDYIWQPIFDVASRLPNVDADKLDANRHISTSLINRIVKRRFVAAGVDPDDIHTHTLRHTAAHLRFRDGEGQDIMKISTFLNHSSVAVTQIYLSKQHKPIDDGWGDVAQQILPFA